MNIPNLISVLLDLLRVRRVNGEVYGGLDKDAILEPPSPEHDRRADVRIVVDHLLCCPFRKPSQHYSDVGHEGRKLTKRNRVGLLAIGQDDLLVCTTYDFPQARLGGVRSNEVACSIRILIADLGVRDGER